jgi:hypothetical protein
MRFVPESERHTAPRLPRPEHWPADPVALCAVLLGSCAGLVVLIVTAITIGILLL